jgi:uncharacterized protein YbaR (Trm112 family)
MEDKQKQELYCHNCDHYVQFELDLSLNGNHVLACPNCGHEHCRVVKDGKITDARWDQRNGVYPNNSLPTYRIFTTSAATTSIYSNAAGGGSGALFLSDSWANASSVTTGSTTYGQFIVS